MKINLDAAILDIERQPIYENGGLVFPPDFTAEKIEAMDERTAKEVLKALLPKKKAFTLGAACTTALLNNFQEEANLPPADKVRRFKLALKTDDGGEQAFSAEDVVLIKHLIGKTYGTLIVGRVEQLIEDAII